eukprot:c19845_g4_i1.p1 GENE.c19845_g4_i1~~c19845_g4_i1.p1  ORF type:complete len:434 (-),score=190.05 c19845_g4_i1:34-1335(-)
MSELNESRFLQILEALIGESQYVQNNPPKFVPEEDKVVDHLLTFLKPYTVENGGVLHVKHLHSQPRRGNLIVQYRPEGATKYVSFVGSHLDVVPADPATWKCDPFKLTVDGDKLYGRGTTDCLGHVALLTDMLCTIGEKKPALKTIVTVCFIASEENSSIPNIGVDFVMKEGHLDEIKSGPVFWVDSSDSHPCIGTAAAASWTLRVDGRLFHSGLPHKGINPIELGSDVLSQIQKRFYQDFPPHPSEKIYNFASPSTMKPTQIRCAEGGLNQIPPWCEIRGDIRLTPFYNIEKCIEKVTSYATELQASVTSLANPELRGPCSKYEVVDTEGKTITGGIKLTFEDDPYKGIACKLDSKGYEALCTATKNVLGEVKPYSICGSLPLVGEMQEAGYDLQVCGYGKSAVYHGDNEFCLLSDMKNAAKILFGAVDLLQ